MDQSLLTSSWVFVDSSKSEITQSATMKSTLDEFVFINEYSGIQASQSTPNATQTQPTPTAQSTQLVPPTQPTPTSQTSQTSQTTQTTQPTQPAQPIQTVQTNQPVDAAPLENDSAGISVLPATVAPVPASSSAKSIQNQKLPDVREYLAAVFRDTSVSEKSPVSVLNGIDDSCVEVLENAGVTNLLTLGALKETNPKICAFLVESGIQPNLNELIEHARILLHHIDQKSCVSAQDLTSSLIQSSSNTFDGQERNHVDKEQHPLSVLPGITEAKLDKYLQSNAFVFTVGQLASLIRDFPGIYAVMTETTPILDEYVQQARKYIQ